MAKIIEDELLLSLLRNDDESALDRLFLKYHTSLVSYARLYLPYPSDESEDIVQEIFFKIWQQRSNLVIHTSFSSYLYITVRNRIHDYYRKNIRPNKLPIDAITEEAEASAQMIPDHQLIFKELNMEIDRLINLLTPASKQVFLMNRDDQLTYSEIAAILNISVNTVKTLMYRALKFLKENYNSPKTSF